MKRLTSLFFFLCIYSFPCFSQEQEPQVLPDSLFILSLSELEDRANQYHENGDFNKGLLYGEVWLQKSKEQHGEQHIEYSKALNNKAIFLINKDILNEAAILATKAVNITEQAVGLDHEQTIQNYITLSLTSLYTGQYQSGLEIIEKIALPARRLAEQKPQLLIDILTIQCLINISQSNIPEATELVEEAEAFALKTYGDQHIEYAKILLARSWIYNITRQGQKGLAVLKDAEKIIPPSHHLYASVVNNLALHYRNVNQKENALDYFAKAARSVKHHFGEADYKYGSLMINMSGLYGRQPDADYERALAYSIKGAEVLKKTLGTDHYFYSNAIVNIGSYHLALHHYSQSIEFLKKAKEIETKNQRTDQTLSIYSVLAKSYEQTGELTLAVQSFQVIYEYLLNIANDRLERMSERQQKNYIKSLRNFASVFYSFSLRHPTQKGMKNLSYNVHLILKGISLDNRKRLIATVRNSEQPLVRQKFSTWNQLKEQIAKTYSLPPAQRSLNIDSLNNELDEIEGALSRMSFEFKKAKEQLNFQDIKKAIHEKEAFIDLVRFEYQRPAYYSSSDSIISVAFITTPHLQNVAIVPFPSDDALGNLNTTKKLYAKQGKLQQYVWSAIQPYLKDVAHIYYSPDGLFHRINFGAIPIDANETIGDRFNISQLSNPGQLVTPLETNFEHSTVLIYGGIDYGNNDNTTTDHTTATNPTNRNNFTQKLREYRSNIWNKLEWTKKEATEVQHLLKGTGQTIWLKTDKEATEESFKSIGQPNDERPSPNIIHIATHGYFFPEPKANAQTGFQASDHPLIRSGLILANANQAWQGGKIPAGKEDGILTAYEIAQLDLKNTELVVLSACETGLGDIESSEGVYGLQRAFKLAGVKYILMSLWAVNDERTYEFMTAFYQKMTNGKTIPEAYRLTQNEMRKKYALPFNPRNWAEFVLVQ